MSKHLVRNTVLATVTVLLFYFAQGAAVVMGQLEGLKAITAQAAIILSWTCRNTFADGVCIYLRSCNGFCDPQDKEYLAMHFATCIS